MFVLFLGALRIHSVILNLQKFYLPQKPWQICKSTAHKYKDIFEISSIFAKNILLSLVWDFYLKLFVTFEFELLLTYLHYIFGNGNPLQCSCLENPKNGGAWWAAVYGVAQSWTQLKQLSSSSSITYFCSVQFSHSVMSNSLWPHELQPARPPCPPPTPRVYSLMSIKSVIPSSHLILCCPLLLLPTIPPSIRVFSNEPTLHIRWPKYWSFSFSISPSNEHPGLMSFRMDWLDLLAVQGTLKSLPQHHNSNASTLRCSAFFTVHLSHPYMILEKP